MTTIDLERMAAMGPGARRAASSSMAHGDGPLTGFVGALHAELLERGIAVDLLDEPDAFRPRLLPPAGGEIEEAPPCGA